MKLSLRCQCGQVRGHVAPVAPATTNRVVCCCKACQRYMTRLGREEDGLDQWGGTEVFQVSPATFQIEEGLAHLRCLQQVPPQGALRWYTSCCHTPVANTLPAPTMPFLAIQRLFVEASEAPASLEDLIGPLRATVNGKLPSELVKEHKNTTGSLLAMLFHFAPLFFKWRWRKESMRSPLYDATKGQWICASTQELAPTTTKEEP